MLCQLLINSTEEVKKALFDIGDLKALGPDSLYAIFYKRFWPMLGEDLVDEVLKSVNSGIIPPGRNDTAIVLITKKNSPDKVTQLWPISLCNVLYKLVSKVLANRLKVVLPDIISENQSAFILGRLITDNVLIAYEITHFLRNK